MTVKAENKYACYSDCAMWKCSKICSHTIACAYVDGHLQNFLNQSTTPPNLYELAKSDTIKKAGKKPSKQKASTKSATKAIATLQSVVRTSTSGEPSTSTLHVHQSNTSQPKALDFNLICSTPSVTQTEQQRTAIRVSASPALVVNDHPSVSVSHSSKNSAQTLLSTPIHPRSSTVPTLSSQLRSNTDPTLSTRIQSSSVAAPKLPTLTQSRADASSTFLGSGSSTAPTTSTSKQSRPSTSSTSSTHSRSDGCGTSGTGMSLHPNISISQVNTTPAIPFNMPTSSLIQSPSISISQVNQQVPASSQQQTMPSSLPNSSPTLASPLAANALITLISQVLSNCNSPTQLSTSGTASVIDPNYLVWVMILSGNISRCQGCSGKIMRNSDGKVLPPPDDLVLQHKERVLFNNPKTGMYQLSSDHRNVYYHPRLSCVKPKFPFFNPGQHCRVNKDTFVRLTQVHKDYIFKEFGISFSG